jgi:peptide-methionine (S)-S-oxide reductase
MSELPITAVDQPQGLEVATFGAGCFWCTEAIYQDLKGVEQVKSGFGGGHVAHPSYQEVCTGTTGHAECIQFFFDPKIISYKELLEIFWSTHDPTTLNQQGADIGPQYRSAIFCHTKEQKEQAEYLKHSIEENGVFNASVVTEIIPFTNFYEAGDSHDNYFKLNGSQPYCQVVIRPKVEKFKKIFAGKLR